MKNYLFAAIAFCTLLQAGIVFAEGPNELNAFEKRGGWKLLFDGKTTDGWRNYKEEAANPNWVVEDGALVRKDKAGNLITKDKYEYFDLQLEYKISEGGNSGVMFMVQETDPQPYQTGPEIQIQDNQKGKDKQKAGWLYQLYSPKADKNGGVIDATRPAGEWNSLFLAIGPKQCEVYMNGIPYETFQIGSDDWNKRIADSKFKSWPNFGKTLKGHICLQDHGDEVAFRNIKIRPRLENGAVPNPSDATLDLKAELAFPKLKLEGWEPVDADGRPRPFRTIFLASPNDDSNKIYVGDQWGAVYSFDNHPDVENAKLVLDIRDKVEYSDRANEQGLLGIAFHPDFKKNGYVYLYYTAKPGLISIVSRFTVKDGKADPKSELEIMRIDQPFWNHNGGTVVFGPDGNLYIALGDGGSGRDPHGNGQKLNTLLGKILRIDVDHPAEGQNYGIPKDNPFVGDSSAAPEIYAYGVRNPWRIAFDSKTGDLWCGEVGQNLWEEIFLIKKGGNYGWNMVEGEHPFYNRKIAREEKLEQPIWEYDHLLGKSITGGNVYRGKARPELEGKYLYADYVTGLVWALKYDTEKNVVISNESVPSNGLPILSFGEDANGETYFCTVAPNGRGIYKFVKK
ncbi:PQQ-dependent sugar dehydrogenase [Planctomicrobium sp. SH664]|uniref:PQQ-dependent sugar dehydrogenase n=1 Tax=Planctomicrobium sp. SH664 TaxID=3448125 RepID=UPI003F5B2293